MSFKEIKAKYLKFQEIDESEVGELLDMVAECNLQEDEATLVYELSQMRKRNAELQKQVDKLKIDFIGAKSYGNSYFMQLKAAEGKVKELQAKLEAEKKGTAAGIKLLKRLEASEAKTVELQSQVAVLIPFTRHLRWCPALLETDPEPCFCGLQAAIKGEEQKP